MDAKLSPMQADPRRDGDVVLPAPKDRTGVEQALSRVAHVASDARPHTAGSDFSAGPRVIEPSPDAALRGAAPDNVRLLIDRPSLGRRALRGLARFVVTVCIGVAATLAWQSYGGPARLMIVSWVPALDGLLSPPAADRPSGPEIAAEQPSLPAVQAPAAQPASAQLATAAPAAAETVSPTAPSPGLQQLDTIVHDLAAVRRSVEQLTAGQEQMARDIAKLQTTGQEIRRRISASPPQAAVPARKPVPPPQQLAQPPQQLAPQSSAAPLAPALPEPPSRPPAPVR
jgi:hypothetical protein